MSDRRLATRILMLAMTVGSVGTFGCTGSPEKEVSATSGEVTLMAYSGVYQDKFTKTVVEPFQEKYPDIEIRYEAAESSAAMLANLRAQKSAPATDVAIMDTSIANTGNEEGLFSPLDPQKVQNLSLTSTPADAPKAASALP